MRFSHFREANALLTRLTALVNVNAAAAEEDKLTEEEIIAQISYGFNVNVVPLTLLTIFDRTFTFAGMDTTSNALCRVLHLLSSTQEAQNRLREELVAAREHAGDLNYDSLMGLPYLDGVVRETLRL